MKEVCAEIGRLGIKSVVVNGVFSPSDLVERQEERVGEWVGKYLPGADVVLSKQGVLYSSRPRFTSLRSAHIRFAVAI